MSLVTAREVAQAIKVDKLGILGRGIGWVILRLLRLNTLNTIYKEHQHLEGIPFLDGLLDAFGIKFEIPEEDIKRLPKKGAYITISNHPLGGVDGILLLKLMLEQRDDFRIIANFLLHRITPLKSYVMPVNPFEDRKDIQSSISGFKQALLHLREEHPLGIFPAGEVSTYKDGKLVIDKPWEEAAVKLIKKAQVPVVPVYFHARNSKLFYALSRINSTLRTAKLPGELLTQKRRVIQVRVGHVIPVMAQQEYVGIEEFSEFLRKKTYMLANTFEKKNIRNAIPKTLKTPKAPKEIMGSVQSDLLDRDITRLRQNNRRLLENKNYEVFLAPAPEMNTLLTEIGRLREITFRAIGEGTNKAIDLDRFDQYYHHMFLWDTKEKCIAGAYRMGLGQYIYKEHGIDGFYLQDLFRFDAELHTMMQQSIEMGRAFIIEAYQQKPMPLFLLWKGIVHTTLRFPEHKYLIGGVSISNQFSDFSKSLMIEFMKSHYWDPYVAQYVRPKKEFKVRLKDADKEFVFDESKADLNKFDKLIDEVEPGNLRLPVLIKKYIKQNAKVVAFNVDPLFNNAIDGLMYIKIADLPENTVKPVMEEFQAALERKYGTRD